MKKKIFALVLVVVMMLSGTVTAEAITIYQTINYSSYGIDLYIEAYCEDNCGGGSTILYDEYAILFVGATYYYYYASPTNMSSIYDCIDDEGYANVHIDVMNSVGVSTETEHSLYYDVPTGAFSDSYSLSAP